MSKRWGALRRGVYVDELGETIGRSPHPRMPPTTYAPIPPLYPFRRFDASELEVLARAAATIERVSEAL